MEQLLREIITQLSRIDSRLDTLETRFDALETNMNNRFDQLNKKLDDYQAENIAADEKLLEMIGVTNDRLDFQMSRIVKNEEEIFFLKRARQA
ncbi:hypothetical protein [Paenibacillus koleovorans]|uniref:hypothetical protein n=1 Tax=Paenibacillus koleovorans TaxID=121608 RepID=UPI000FDA4110|nr:hypothetical protein [Paenibacillus koleovorans]